MRFINRHNLYPPLIKGKPIRSLREIDYQLNIGELNGQYIKHGQYGGLPGAIRLMNYSLEIAKRHSVKDKDDDDHV